MVRRVRWPLLLALSSWCLTWAVEGSAVQPLASEEQRQADRVNQSRKDAGGRLGAPTGKGRRPHDPRRADGNLRVDPHQRIPEEEAVLGRRRRLPEELIVQGESTGEQQELMRDRDFLNGLVAESAAQTREQACNVAFVKTHKTASTTLAMILVRYARRHDKKLASFGGNHVSAIPLEEAAEQIKSSGERVDVMHYHYTAFGLYTRRWQEATAMYERIMREDERINYISVVRDARSHFLSFYYFYVQPEVNLSVQHFYGKAGRWMKKQHARLENPMCLEFGIRSEKDLDAFIEEELPKFRLVILTDKFDEGLMVLRLLMGWDMIDMTYSRMMATEEGTRRWDMKELKRPPRFEDLPGLVQEIIDRNTALDRKLYAAAEELYERRKEVWAGEISAKVEEFHELQGMLSRYLERNSSSEANLWYSGSVQPYLGGPPFHPFR